MNEPQVGRGLLRPVIDQTSLEEIKALSKMTAKQKIDYEKILRCGHVHPYRFNEWVRWTGNNYIKSWYDVMLPNGTVIEHMWPNAGKLVGKGYEFTDADEVKVKLSETSPF